MVTTRAASKIPQRRPIDAVTRYGRALDWSWQAARSRLQVARHRARGYNRPSCTQGGRPREIPAQSPQVTGRKGEEEFRARDWSAQRAHGADKFGFTDLAAVHWNLTDAPLYEHAIRNGEATVMAGGALCAETGEHTGRSPKDKHTVVDAQTEHTVWWDGNRKITPAQFVLLYNDFWRTRRASSSTPRTSMAAPIRNTGSRRGSTPNWPGIRCSSASS